MGALSAKGEEGVARPKKERLVQNPDKPTRFSMGIERVNNSIPAFLFSQAAIGTAPALVVSLRDGLRL
jgi:hypothetical protein